MSIRGWYECGIPAFLIPKFAKRNAGFRHSSRHEEGPKKHILWGSSNKGWETWTESVMSAVVVEGCGGDDVVVVFSGVFFAASGEGTVLGGDWSVPPGICAHHQS